MNNLPVEVKGVSGADLQFPITRGEVGLAASDPAFRLMVVTGARAPNTRLWQFKGHDFRRLFRLTPLSYLATKT